MNKWKLAFWLSVTLLLISSLLSIYTILDQGVTITYMKEGYQDTEDDLRTLSEIMNETGLSKLEIKNIIEKSEVVTEYSHDTISLKRVQLIFTRDTLRKVAFQW